LLGCGGVLLSGGIAGVWYFGTGRQGAGPDAALLGAGLCLFFVGLAVYVIITTLSARIIISAEAIEFVTWFGGRRLLRAELKGYRISRPPKYLYASSRPPIPLLAPSTT
jgi:hypothetical protein